MSHTQKKTSLPVGVPMFNPSRGANVQPNPRTWHELDKNWSTCRGANVQPTWHELDTGFFGLPMFNPTREHGTNSTKTGLLVGVPMFNQHGTNSTRVFSG